MFKGKQGIGKERVGGGLSSTVANVKLKYKYRTKYTSCRPSLSQPKVLSHTLPTHKIECFMYLFVLNSGTLDLELRCVCSQPGPGIIPPVRDARE